MDETSDNLIFVALMEGGASAAWEAFRNLDDPQATDLRWAGVARFQVQAFEDARDLLMAATAKGSQGASVDLATVHRQLGDVDQCARELERVGVDNLTSLDATAYWRERGQLEFLQGNLESGRDALERAWRISFASRRGASPRVGIAITLGIIHASLGNPQEGARLVDRALRNALPAPEAYLRSLSGLCGVYSGDFEHAERSFALARDALKHAPLLEPVLTYNEALLRITTGEWERALERLTTAARLAREVGERETEFYVMQVLSAVHARLGDARKAREAFARAKELVLNDKTRGMLGFREACLAVVAGDDLEKARVALYEALAIFEELRIPRETAWAHLHLANLHHLAGRNEERDAHLQEATNARNRWGSGGPLLIELRLLPRLVEHLARLPEDEYASGLFDDYQAFAASETQALVRTLGVGKGIEMNGEVVKVGLRHAPDILAYLALNPRTPLDKIARDVFPDVSPGRGKNYFHQARHQIAKQVPGVRIVYRSDRTYELEAEGVDLRFDFRDALQAIEQGTLDGLETALKFYRGEFLEGRDDEWVMHVRDKLETTIGEVGREVLQASATRVTRQGTRSATKATDLGWHLLEIEPEDVDVGLSLLNLALAADGPTAAKQARRRLSKHFEYLLDEIPEEIRDWSPNENDALLAGSEPGSRLDEHRAASLLN